MEISNHEGKLSQDAKLIDMQKQKNKKIFYPICDLYLLYQLWSNYF